MQTELEAKQWTWDMAEQAYYHQQCDAFSDRVLRVCPCCHKPDPDYFTWGEVLQWSRDNGWADDEYCDLWDYDEDGKHINDVGDVQVFSHPDYPRIGAHWHPGDNEGYYVHVDSIVKNQHTLRIIAKFWSMDRAAGYADAVTRFIYSHR